MIVKHLRLYGFRSYSLKDFEFQKGVNIITGPNGSGKTNVVEALYFLSLGRSWRTREQKHLIKDGSDRAMISASLAQNNKRYRLDAFISPSEKKMAINLKGIARLSELTDKMNAILFTPEDVDLFRGSPGKRRNFLDITLGKQSLDYYNLLSRYNHLLSERNLLLKNKDSSRNLLRVLTSQMIDQEEYIVKYRASLIKKLGEKLQVIANHLFGKDVKVRLEYHPFLKSGQNFKSDAEKLYLKSEELDYLKKSTSIGIHREDFTLYLNDKDIAIYGSQGENRLMALALKVTPYFIIEDEDKRPIVILDDVYSELDYEHQNNLTTLLQKFNQTFITSTNIKIKNAAYFDVTRS